MRLKIYLILFSFYFLLAVGCIASGKKHQTELDRLNSEVSALREEIKKLNDFIKVTNEKLDRMKFNIIVINRELIDLKGGEDITVAEEITKSINKLRNRDVDIERVSRELKPYGKSALVPLLYALKEPNLEFRQRVEKTLTYLPGKDTVGVLSEGLKDPQTCISAARILGSLKDPTAIPNLVEYITTENKDFGLVVAEALVELKDKRGLPMLIEYLKSKNGVHRALAIDCLSRATGRTFGYKHYALKYERLKAVDKWKKWWVTEGPSLKFKDKK